MRLARATVLAIAVVLAIATACGGSGTDEDEPAQAAPTLVHDDGGDGCEAALGFGEVDKAVRAIAASSSYERQEAAHDAWVDALQQLMAELPPGDPLRESTATLQGAPTEVSSESWNTSQELAYEQLLAFIEGCRQT